MFSVVNAAVGGQEYDTKNLEIETGIAIEPVEGWVAKLFYFTEGEDSTVDLWTSYETGSFTFAFEYGMTDFDNDDEATGVLAMANYASGAFGITLRLHDYSKESGGGDTIEENSGVTLAPSYAIGDNLLLVAEYRMDDMGDAGDVDTFALEALFTF
jgi:hypothetical protein